MKKLQKIFVFTGLISILTAPAAMASVSLVGVGSQSMPTETILGSSVAGNSGTLGFGGGVLFDFPVSSSVKFQLGGLYNQSGYSNSGVSVSWWNIQVPVTFKIGLGHVFFLDLGGYLTNAVGSVTASAGGVSGSVGNISDLNFNALNYGLAGGIGLNIPMGGVGLLIEGLYQYQLSNSFNSSVTAADSTAKFQLPGALFLVGLTFGGHSMR